MNASKLMLVGINSLIYNFFFCVALKHNKKAASRTHYERVKCKCSMCLCVSISISAIEAKRLLFLTYNYWQYIKAIIYKQNRTKRAIASQAMGRRQATGR